MRQEQRSKQKRHQAEFEFNDAVAFKTTRPDKWPDLLVAVVVLTIEPIDLHEVTSSVKESGDWTAPNHTRLILRFESEGQLLGAVFLGYAAEAGAFQVATDPAAIETEIVLTNEEVRGEAWLPGKASYFGKSYTFRVEFVARFVGMSDPPGHIVLFNKRQKGGQTCVKTKSEMP